MTLGLSEGAMTVIKKNAMLAKRRIKSLNIIDTIPNGTPILTKHIQQLFQLGAIQFSINDNGKLMGGVEKFIHEKGR